MAAPSASVDALADGYWSGRFVDESQDVQGYMTALVAAGHYAGLAWYGLGWNPGEYWLQILADDGNQALVVNFSSH